MNIIEKIEKHDFECEEGYLQDFILWIQLKDHYKECIEALEGWQEAVNRYVRMSTSEADTEKFLSLLDKTLKALDLVHKIEEE